ncbi:MAG TPA: hypothetical protein DCY07_08715 [Rhodospirillaceae bacterium]|nr:hypothetical protein [Rhodospirillaceae bacterium]
MAKTEQSEPRLLLLQQHEGNDSRVVKRSFLSSKFSTFERKHCDKASTSTKQHEHRVALLGFEIATLLGVSDLSRSLVLLAGMFHDTGKRYVKDPSIFLKNGKLSPADREIIEPHAQHSQDIILKELQHPFAPRIALIAGQHHELLDGTGYPNKCVGSEIDPRARIITAVDIFDALTNNRPYRQALSYRKALTIIHRDSGTKLDKDVVGALTTLVHNKQGRTHLNVQTRNHSFPFRTLAFH